jgi:ATP:ADP antiporter, AAA family
MALVQKLLSPVVEMRKEESTTALLMFAYSFLVMWAYNVIRPITRSAFIKDLGADNLPWMPLVASFIIAAVMAGYTATISRLPRRWGLPIIQAAMVGALVAFWFLFKTGSTWVAVAFYLWGLLLGILLTSQFWTLANVTYDPRQAKRLFGFIGAGAPLGGMAGGFMAYRASALGTFNLVLYSAAILTVAVLVVVTILAREQPADVVSASASEEKGVGFGEALRLLGASRHLQIIAIAISFAALGANIIEQQLNMATEAAKGRANVDGLTSFLGLVLIWTSSIAFVIQVWLTSRIHRYLGIGFALLVLPIGFGSTAVVMLLNAALWAPSLARVLDQSLRYTVDKTTREILFLPLPTDLKYRAKPFVDVTVDRVAKGVSGLLMLILVKPWGLGLNWQQVSFASLIIVGLWIATALRVKRQYVAAFRDSLSQRVVQPDQVRLAAADLSTIETLVQELGHPDEHRVLYAIDVLESLDKGSLVTPLLLYHEAPAVRVRALRALAAAGGNGEAGQALDAARVRRGVPWLPQIRRLLSDPDAGVRAAAITAMAAINQEDAVTVARPLLADPDPRIRATAVVALAGSSRSEDVDAAEEALQLLSSDARDTARQARRDVAVAIRSIAQPRFRPLLIPLLYDPAPEVAEEAMAGVRAVGASDFIFVPTLVALLRHRQLKAHAREVLVSYGEPVVEALAHFMRDPNEDAWIRRHIPATLARIPCQTSVDALVSALGEADGFLRYKVIAALERLRRERDDLRFAREPIEALALTEARTFFTTLSLSENLFARQSLPRDSLLAQALAEKLQRSKDRIYRLLALIYPWRDIAAARWTLERGDGRSRASASEYLDNVLTGQLRKRVMPVLEDMPMEERVRRGNVLERTRPRDVEETLLQLINDDNQVVAAAAIDVVRERAVWSLADDVEHVLAHRDARDWYVFEAASWALAERRLEAGRRRELWLEPLPAAVLAGMLRRLPLFASVSVDELFRIAGSARQIRHESGTVLAQEGLVSERVHLLLDGQVTATSREAAPHSVAAPASLGFVEALQGLPMPESLRTIDIAVTLALTGDELRTLLADNTDLVSGLFATLAERSDWAAAEPVHSTGAGPELQPLAAGGVTGIEKVLALQRVPLFARVSAGGMQELAAIAQTVTMTAGSELFAESAPQAMWLLLSGELALTSPSAGHFTARGGDAIGSISTMAGQPLGLSASVVRSGMALRLERETLFDVLGMQPELLRQIFGGLFGADARTG